MSSADSLPRSNSPCLQPYWAWRLAFRWASPVQFGVAKPIDHILRIVMLIGYSVPIFWLALMALVLFYVKLDWLPGPGRQHFLFIGQTDKITGILMIDSLLQGRLDVMRDAIYHLVLPVSMLTLFSLAFIGRMTRSFMLDQLSQEYVLTARVKGLPEHVVIGKTRDEKCPWFN